MWQKAHELVLEIYKVTEQLPSHEKYGLISQIRRSSVSVPLNIVEGRSRNSTKEYINFLYISRASCDELHYLLLLCKDLNYINIEVFEKLTVHSEEILKMLNGLIRSLKKQELNPNH